MQTNLRTPPTNIRTHEGAPAIRQSAVQELRRAVTACLLWEDTFYESGAAIVDRIRALVPQCDPVAVGKLAVESRTRMKIRHASLLLARELARHPAKPTNVADTVFGVIERADELAEFVSMYWQDNKDAPLSKQVKRGLARAFGKFDAYQLAKYDRAKSIRLRDVAFMVHPKPADQQQAQNWARLVNKDRFPTKYAEREVRPQGEFSALDTPDTWEVALSAGAGENKRETWERLLREKKLGALALLRNLRNMLGAAVDPALIRECLDQSRVDRVLPYRFIAAARYAPQLESDIERAMFRSIEGLPKLAGETVLLIDVSGSMDSPMSGKSEMLRIDAACGLAVLAREMCERVRVFTFSNQAVEVAARRGFALRDAVKSSQPHAGTALGGAVSAVRDMGDRLLVFTDEQSSDPVGSPGKAKGYMVNVAAYKNGVGYGDWTRVEGFSEAILDYVRESEQH